MGRAAAKSSTINVSQWLADGYTKICGEMIENYIYFCFF